VSPITAVLSGLMVVIGVALIVRTLSSGGGALAVGLLMGVLFIAAGAGRLWAERRR
jgi:multisubunit Na+/H+ antiporter MnhB subunit